MWDFGISGVLTFGRKCDKLLAKITTPRDIYKTLNALRDNTFPQPVENYLINTYTLINTFINVFKCFFNQSAMKYQLRAVHSVQLLPQSHLL